MSIQDKTCLMHQVEGTLRTRMFANLLEEAMGEINDHLEGYDVEKISEENAGSEDLLDAFITAKKVEGRTEKTLIAYRYKIERLLKFVKVPIRVISANDVRAYFVAEQNRGIADSTLDGDRQKFSSFFGWLFKERLISINPMSSISPIKYEKKVRKPISKADMDKLRRACGTPRDYAILNFLMSTGCRVEEMCSLDRKNVNLESGECIVYGKGRKERTVWLGDVAKLVLKEYLATRKDDLEPLFLGKRKTRFTQSGVRRMLNKIATIAGCEHIHPHRFRRTCITTLLDSGMHLQEVAVYVGHEKVETTMRYYTANPEAIKSSVMRFGR